MKLPVYNQEGSRLEEIELDPQVFDGRVNQEVLYQVVLLYRANRRKGLASTKTRGEVSGGGVKPWRQKGTGRARVGSIRSPLWRKGGVVFGPHPRDYSFRLPQKIRIAALKSSLNAKLKENNLLILDELKISTPKTKEAIKMLSVLRDKAILQVDGDSKKKKHNNPTLIMLEQINPNLKLSFRNVAFLDIIRVLDTNAYDVLKAKRMIITLGGLKILVQRIKVGLSRK